MESPAPASGADLRSPWEEGSRGVFDIGDAGRRLAHLSINDRGGHGAGHAWGCAVGQSPPPGLGELSLFKHTLGGPDARGGGEDGHPRFPARRLYPQSSMVARLAEDKDFVDPKDVPKLLPTELLDSKSLDLAGILDSMEQNNELPPDLPPRTPPVEDPVCSRPSSNAESGPPGLPRMLRPDGSVRELRPGMIGTRSAPSCRKLPPASYVDHAAHSRSSSEPVYAGEALAAVPVLALVPASRLPAVSAAFPPLGAQLWADCQKRAGDGRHRRKGGRAKVEKAGSKKSSSGSGDAPSPMGWDGGRGRATGTPETPGSSAGDCGSRGSSAGRKKGAKKGGRQAPPQPVPRAPSKKEGSGVAAAKVPIGPPAPGKLKSRKSVSKGEVKRLVRYQVWVGRPIRTPWYREKPRGMRREGAEDSGSEDGADEEGELAARSPSTPKTPPPREYPKPPIRPRLNTQRVASAVGPSAASGTPVAAGASPSSPDVKGTGFFCPRAQTAGRK